MNKNLLRCLEGVVKDHTTNDIIILLTCERILLFLLIMSTPPPRYSPLQNENKNPPQSQFQQLPPYFQQGIPPQFIQQGQPQPMMQPVQQVVVQPYQPGAMVSVVPRPPLLPREFQPNDYLVVTLVITIACAVFNLTSLFFSIPAIICSALAFERRSSGYYADAKYLGVAAIILDIICLMWTLAWGIIITAVTAACYYSAGICDYYY